MKVLRIPVWDNDSGVTHESTSWQLASDIDFENIIDEVVDSTKYLDYWAVNVVVPQGKIYYVRAKRKFKEVDNDVWIGPKKVINDEAGLSEIIKPEANIEMPYISNIVLDYEDGLTITLTPFKGSVPHSSTSWLIKDSSTGEVLFKSMYDTDNLTELNIDTDTVDFNNIPYITVTSIFHGMLGIESSPTIEVVEISKKYYSILANKKIVPADVDYTGTIKQETSRKVGLVSAELFTVDKKKVADGEINDNTYTFKSSLLVPHMSYIVKLTLQYDNDDSTNFNTAYSFFTKTVTEKVIFDKNRTYKELYDILVKEDTLVLDKQYEDLKDNDLKKDIQLLSEETYVGVIPFISADNKLKGYFFSRNDGMFNYIKPLEGFDKDFKTFVKVELTPNNYMYIDTVVTKQDDDGNDYDTRVLYVYKFNPYTFAVEYINEFTRDDEIIPDFNSNSYGVLNGEFYWAATNNDDKTKVIIRKVNKDTMEVETFINRRLDENVDKEMDNVWFSRVTYDRFIVAAQYYNDDSEFFGFVYDVSKDETYKLFTIPKEVRNNHVTVHTLDNGNIIIQRVQLDDSKLYYVILDSEHADNIETKYGEPMIDKDLELTSTTKFKSGNINQFGYLDDKGTSLLWS